MSQYNHFCNDESRRTVVVERLNDHRVVTRTRIPMPSPFSDREVVVGSTWKKLDKKTFFVAQISCLHPGVPVSPNMIRVHFRQSIKLTSLDSRRTMFEASASLMLGGSISRRINDTVTLPVISRVPVALAT